MKSENVPDQSTIAPGEMIELSTRFGCLSRGKAWGKYFANRKRPTGEFEWVDKTGGTLFLSGPGYYIVGSNDGFNRSAKAGFYLGTAEPVIAAIHEAQQMVAVAHEVAASGTVESGAGI